ncbi:TetR/AcrR family transcriptional regulator [Amycolatopsis jejuensis]|uniref:TetR/AcrR family transcriptional regulator n=1 Tax=Amycolatopsis jejuensis TaxID=330084 RepID=UPI000526D212|nr:TetR/AcrR family transcriptional regulator [Amycolatopsis jejuensis]
MNPEAGRARNRRGEGTRLRDEIVQAAAGILDDGGSEDAVTLRAVARRIGIAAPSIYRHFADRDEILLAVVEEAFAELKDRIEETVAAQADPEQRLRGICSAYLDFALERPKRYRVLFGGVWDAARAAENPEMAPAAAKIGQDVFQLLVQAVQDCADAGVSRSTAPFSDATTLWAGLHGYAELRPAAPMFPWADGVPDDLVRRLALLD